ncbi:antibiotic biosynthesis monooxygenase family protein [Spirillospora albida]|uniref:antibiotic biosynthesis monooxygenase family protein n=1 Tax=Spirillospora albida TaxID=58123 RepID=UPI0004BEE629|nr:antibiotic biosynthesis monooxygenase family protein [Spirillospora albida]
MIIEHALLSIVPDRSTAFEEAFKKCEPVLAEAAGFMFVDLLRQFDKAGSYLLILAWASSEAATGFRTSPQFKTWMDQVGPHFAGPVSADYFEVLSHYPPEG